MFNLVKYRKLFVVFSLIIIVPGFISLLLYGLNVGIDFTNGSSVSLRPQKAFATSDDVLAVLKPFNLNHPQVVLGTDASTPAWKTAWVRMNTQVDDTVNSAVITDLQNKFSLQTSGITPSTIPAANGQPAYTLYTLSGFQSAPTVSEIQDALKNLPKTTGGSQPSTTATPTASAVNATATAKASGTPAVTPASTATATSSTPATPLKIEDIQLGTTTQTVQILTTSTITSASQSGSHEITVPDIQGAFIKQGAGYFQSTGVSQVSPEVAAETTRNAILAVIAATFFILLYVWFSFRKVPKALRYGVCAILALLHDVLVVLGIFSILGKLFNIQIDSLFITAVLTVVGFSVHDTIVVFDRIRENMQRRTSETFEQVVNASLVQTMARSLNTSLTVLFTLLTLTLFTNPTTDIHTFTLALLIGIFSGTYSSIFNASMLLVMWDQGEWGFQLLGGGEGRERVLSKREQRERARELAVRS